MLNFIATDTETGGFRPGRHALLSIGAGTSWEAPAFSVYLLPQEGYTVEPEAAEKNGYTPALWTERGAVTLLEGLTQFQLWLAQRFQEQPEARMLAHNAGHDSTFLDEAAAITGIRLPIQRSWRCSMDKLGTLMDRGILPTGKATLDRLGELSGLWPIGCRPPVHEAQADAQACLFGYLWLLEKEKAGTESFLRGLYELGIKERAALQQVILDVADYMNARTGWDEVGAIAQMVTRKAEEIRGKEGR